MKYAFPVVACGGGTDVIFDQYQCHLHVMTPPLLPLCPLAQARKEGRHLTLPLPLVVHPDSQNRVIRPLESTLRA